MRLRKFSTFVSCLCVALLLAQKGGRALPLETDALRFFNNFFVTGDYVVGGAGLWNSGAGSINVSAAPEGAEALAAFLYWQVVTSADPTFVDVNAGATFNDLPLNVPLGSQLLPTAAGLALPNATNACPLNGGTSKNVHTFRADVLSALDVDPATGRRVINKVGGYPVAFPGGGGNVLGASLVVIYRHPNPTTPLNAIIIYDGTFVKQQPLTLIQRVEGFYDPASVPGQITYIAGSAQGVLGETLTGPFDAQNGLFDGALGNTWDNVTRTTADLSGAAFFDTSIAPQYGGFLSFLNDCIAMGAMVYRTQVNDLDLDGLLDTWESSTSTLYDPNGNALPNLNAMGAVVNVQDIFIDVNAMQAPPGTTYGSEDAPLTSTTDSVTDPLGHLHLAPPPVWKILGDAFAAKNIRLHVDVGNPAAYKALLAYPGQNPLESPYNSSVADDYIIGAGGLSGSDPALAKGGEVVEETACMPGFVDHDSNPDTPDVEVACQFPDYPGTVSWPTGVALYEALLFDAVRKDSFHYAFFAHAKATPKSLLPCLGPGGVAAGIDLQTGECAAGAEPNPLINVPAGVSGTAEYPGKRLLVALGLWDDTNFTATNNGIAFTFMHEFGHNVFLGHNGGDAATNCNPGYQSVMNYLFQLGGLVDLDGVPHANYSETQLLAIDELTLSDGYQIPGPYRTSWYAPLPPGDPRTPAKRFCNGLKFDPAAPPPDTIRIDGVVDPSFLTPIDWNADGDLDDVGQVQDVNFDGEPDAVPGGPTTTLDGYNDWANLRLNQIGSGRSFAGMSIGPLGVRPLADGSQLLANGWILRDDGSVFLADGSQFLADGSVFLADGSQFLADGSVFLADGVHVLADGTVFLADGSVFLADGARPLADGSIMLGNGSVFLSDGTVFLADGSVFLADGVHVLADGAVFLADGSPLLADGATIAWQFAEPTPLTAAESSTIPGPNSLTACVIGGSGVSACPAGPPTEPLHRVFLDWEPPSLGSVDHYRVYRFPGDTVPPVVAGEVAEVPGTQTSLLDDTELPNGLFTYVVEAVLDDGTVTPPSNYKVITAENTPPVAYQKAVEVWEDWQSDTIVLTGEDPDSADLAFNVVSGPANGGLTGTPPDVSYLSALNYNGPDSFTFTLRETSTWMNLNQVSDPAEVSLTVNPVNDKPSFTKGPNQVVTQPAGGQTVVGWATGFDAGPPDEDASQAVLQYIVSNDNTGLFEAGGQPAVAPNGTLTYTPKADGPTGTANVSVQVQDNGGTAEGHGAIDTSDPQYFTITINPPPATPITFQRTDVWMTTSSANRTFDLKAEVLKNGVPVLEKIIWNTTLGYGTTFNKAIYKQIGSFANTVVGFTAGDTLSVRVSIKVSNSSAGGSNASGAIRLWYNIPTPPGNDSHLHANRDGTDVKYFMITAFQLQQDGVVSGPTQYIPAIVYKAAKNLIVYGTEYKELGTWSVTGP